MGEYNENAELALAYLRTTATLDEYKAAVERLVEMAEIAADILHANGYDEGESLESAVNAVKNLK